MISIKFVLINPHGVGGNSIQFVDFFTHLGHVISSDLDDCRDVANRQCSLSGDIPIFDEICRRSMRFAAACLQHVFSLMRILVQYIIYSWCFGIWQKY